MISTEALEQRRAEMLREAKLAHLEQALQANRKRPTTPRWVSMVAWELARVVGILRKFFRKPKNAD